ncbi:uncharacterized protein N7459_008925 [Penicillium hispanicum]|uniref:uncharacterized protein n=1 Tax=Penicillium hispanicum TaxID=1080232 RepID=UPI002540958F|nr:uncharacterized protein N7459_008925 [Penicillium hispanicum]KAJ5569495.1 hypothetical protein N7459_008925 [Penicillium hispanicum]
MSEEEKQKLEAEEAKEKANSEETEGCEQSEAIEANPTEQDAEEWTTDEGSFKVYEYDHTDDQGQVTQPAFGTGPIQVAAKTAKKAKYGGALITGGGFQQKASKNSVNIVPVEDYFWIPSTGASFLLMPYQEGGDFVDHITTYNAQGQTAVNKAILQALDGLKAMHDLGIMHRDLKPGNIMVNDGTLLIADFDAATDQEKATQWLVGTPGFLPPEILRLQAYDKNSDVFSMGMTWIYTSFSKIWPWDQQEAFWKALMGPRNGNDFLTPRDVKGLLIEWFDMDKDMRALAADVLCGPDKRINAGDFYTRLEDLIKNAA